jgi:hypothetical protein
MANVLTDLAADLYTAAQQVGREQVGFIPASNMNMEAVNAAKGDTVRAAFAPQVTAGDVTPSMTIPEGNDQTVGNKTMTLDKFKSVPIPYTNEDVRHLNNGAGYETVLGKQIEQAMRSLSNQIEADLATQATLYASNAYGTAGTTPFGTAGDLTDASQVLKLLKDDGAAEFDNQLVINTSAGANFIGKQSQVDMAGTADIRNQGILIRTAGMDIRESAQAKYHVAGDAASATTDNAGYAIGATEITLASAGTGAILAGDIITFAGDSTKYAVLTGDADVSGGGTITLVGGLKQAIAASATAITVIGSSARNIAFSRNAVEFAMRASDGDDAAVDMMTVQDPVSGLVFAVKEYRGYNKKMIDVSALWGVKVWQPEHVKALLG